MPELVQSLGEKAQSHSRAFVSPPANTPSTATEHQPGLLRQVSDRAKVGAAAASRIFEQRWRGGRGYEKGGGEGRVPRGGGDMFARRLILLPSPNIGPWEHDTTPVFSSL